MGLAIASNEVSARLTGLMNGGPTEETYRNLKYGYGYAITVPQGWFLYGESSRRSEFDAYESNRDLVIRRYGGGENFNNQTDASQGFATWYWGTELPENLAADWTHFARDPIARESRGGPGILPRPIRVQADGGQLPDRRRNIDGSIIGLSQPAARLCGEWPSPA